MAGAVAQLFRMSGSPLTGIVAPPHRYTQVFLEEAGENETKTSDNHERLELWSAVKSLERELRTVVVLYYYEDIKQNDIAEILGIPCGTVKSRISRAKEKLRDLLDIKL